MAIRIFAILFSIFSLATFAHAQEGTLERSDWRKFFSEFQAKGTIVVADERQADRAMLVFDPVRSKKRYSPASTFKIPHTLFALDAGAVRDEFQIFRWDGVNRGFAGHNQDQDLRSAMRNSTVWVYELFAKEIGDDKARRYLKKIDYGNADPSTSNGDYWIEGSLAISAQEQIAFLRKLYRNELPLIDIRLFRRAGFAAAVVTASLTGAAMYGGLLLIPIFLQDSLHQSPTDAGLMLFLMGLGSAVILPIAGNLTDRYGALAVCLVGSTILLLSTAAFFWPSMLPLALASILFVRGGGLALAQMPAMTAAYAAVLKNETSDAATIINIAQRLGGALGAITTVIVLEQAATTDNQLAYGWGGALLVAFAVASMVTSTLLKPPLKQSD